MNEVLARWNVLPEAEAEEEILSCCGSAAWARELTAHRPFSDESSLVTASDEIWRRLGTQDWMEAFSKHPRIGDRKAPHGAPSRSAAWSEQEQKNVMTTTEAVQGELTEANREYERRFGRVFIVCATGKSAPEMLDILRRRLRNDESVEMQEAAEEQRKITSVRLKKWLHP